MSWNVVDSSAWLEYLSDGPNAGFFEKPIRDRANLVVPAVTVYEASKVLRLRQGVGAAEELVLNMQKALVVPLTGELANMAARLSLEYRLAMADAMIAATAQAFDATLWTQDLDFKGLPNVRYKAKK